MIKKILIYILAYILLIIVFLWLESHNKYLPFTLIGILFIGVGIKKIIEINQLKKIGILTKGKIIGFERKYRIYVPLIEYTDFEGNLHQNTLTHYAKSDYKRIFGNNEKVNQSINIIIHPEKPNLITKQTGINFIRFTYCLFIFGGIVFTLVGLYKIIN